MNIVESTKAIEPTMAAKVTENAKIQATMEWPLIGYALLGGFYLCVAGKSTFNWTWFNWHPFLMLLSFVSVSANAALIKKIGGYENTKMHGNLMWVATFLATFAWYVIYSNKEMYGKQHLLSIHGKLGAGVMIGYFGVGIAGGVLLHPDFGIMKTNQTFRFIHKWAGRVLTALAWACCVLGNLC